MKILLPLLAILVSGCTTYSHTHSYPSASYGYQPRPAYYQQYPRNYAYYGGYRPGWFVGMGFGGSYYGGWAYGGPAPYWPTYSYSYYQPSYYYAYPYYDPWYYSYSGYYMGYRHGYYGRGYGYGSAYWPGYRYGHAYNYPPNYGGSHSYRPPGQKVPPQQRPDPVTIPRDQRGRRGLDQGYLGDVAERPHQRYGDPRERRSATVVTEQQGLNRSVTVAPGSAGDQGMVVSSSSERKVQQSRMHPTPMQADGSARAVTARDKAYGRNPARSEQRAQPVTRISNMSGQESPQAGAVPMSRQPRPVNREAPARQPYAAPRQAPAYSQQPQPRSQPGYQQSLNSGSMAPRDVRRPQSDDNHIRDDRNR